MAAEIETDKELLTSRYPLKPPKKGVGDKDKVKDEDEDANKILAVITDRKALKSPPYLSIFMACDEKNFSWSKMKELAADIYVRSSLCIRNVMCTRAEWPCMFRVTFEENIQTHLSTHVRSSLSSIRS